MRPEHCRQRDPQAGTYPVMPPAVALGAQRGRRVGPGGGNWWGGGPRTFVGPTRGVTHTEVGRPGDFPAGGSGARLPTDRGFPTASRWPGYPDDWVPPFYDTGRSFTGGYGYPGGDRLGGGSALTGRIATVFTCVDLVSRTLATMSLKVTDEGIVDVPPPDWTKNPEPAIYTSIVEPMQGIVNSLLLRGNAIVAPTARFGDGTVARWVVLDPDQVQIDPGRGGIPVYTLGGMQVPRSELLHIRYQHWPGEVSGVGPLEAAARNLVSADALQAWGTELSVANGIPAAVLQSEAKLNKTQAEEIKLSWAESAMSRGTIPAVLGGGLTYKPLNLSPKDVGLLDLRLFDEQRIASAIGCPLWLVGLPVNDGLTYSTVNGTFDYFWRATLRPLAYNVACAFSWWALPPHEYLRFSSEQLTEPPIAERAGMYETLIRAGVIDPEEARAMEHLAPRGAVGNSQLASSIRNPGV
jgi:HK97 family phage portal protein